MPQPAQRSRSEKACSRPSIRTCTSPRPQRSAASSESTTVWRRSRCSVTRSSTTVTEPSGATRVASSSDTTCPSSSSRRSPAWANSSRSAAGLALPTRVGKQISAGLPLARREQAIEDRARRGALSHLAAAPAVQLGHPRVERPQVVGHRGHGPHRRARGAHRRRAVDGHRGQHPLDALGLGAIEPLEELPGVGAEGLDVAPVALGVQHVEGQRGLARPRHPGHRGDRPQRHPHRDALEVVLPGPFDPDGAQVFHRRTAQHDRPDLPSQGIVRPPCPHDDNPHDDSSECSPAARWPPRS